LGIAGILLALLFGELAPVLTVVHGHAAIQLALRLLGYLGHPERGVAVVVHGYVPAQSRSLAFAGIDARNRRDVRHEDRVHSGERAAVVQGTVSVIDDAGVGIRPFDLWHRDELL